MPMQKQSAMGSNVASPQDIAERLLTAAKKHGGDAADAMVGRGVALEAEVRLGKLESVEHSESTGVGLRVFVGNNGQNASVSSSSYDDASIDALASRAVAMARLAPPDPYAGLADAKQLATKLPDCDLLDEYEAEVDTLKKAAFAVEATALAEPGISNSDGGGASFSRSTMHIAISNGFSHGYSQSGFGLGVAVLAEKNGTMESDGDFSHAIHYQDLRTPEAIGKRAAQRCLARLGAKQVKTGQFPVIFDQRVAGSISHAIAAAINGAAIARGTSFLKDSMGKQIASPAVHISDEPLRKRGTGSAPFDGEGLPRQKRVLVEDGVLRGWLLNLAAARQLKLPPTGNATLGGGTPATSNWILRNGDASRDELIADVKQGLLVTELMGSSVNLITGDYSRGAAGFWIEGGSIAYPVSEATIAGNLKDMLKSITPANDPDLSWATICPSLRIDGMTIAGS